ncbi:LysR family transcriptional regulator [Cupriavidus metallidurans]|uniref:LysR family transcriptional regulator n=1 Tax=Cupriavidus metallidurans TaxID=119219 RepID=UPI001BFC2173|nr:LysR family transcriptional regulator [Cupriavidus metallidurans]QWC91232.1 LysR family transcriptional regulator [Cupriavidus metallidurans]
MQKVNVRTFDLNLLALFVTLWETRSVTRASDRLALSQPAVSHALRRLRGAMGDELFVSTKGGLVPTARGEALIGPVRDALEQIERALQEREAFVPALSQREFNIAATDYFEFSILPQLVEHVSSQAPGIVIRLAPVPEGETASQLLESGDLDAIVSAHPAKGMGIAHEMLDEVSLTTMIWKSEGLRKRRFPLALYLKRPHVVIRSRQSTIVDQTLAERGERRQIGAVVQNFMAMPMIAARTGYICNVPSRMAATFAGLFDLSVHEPPLDFAPSPLYMSWHRRCDADPAHVWLLQQIRAMVPLD